MRVTAASIKTWPITTEASWNETMATVRAQYAVPEPEDEVDPFTVTEYATEIALTDLGPSPKSICVKAAALGWETTIRRSVTHHEAVRLLNDGKTGQKGDVKTAAHDRRHYFIASIDPTHRVGFTATWQGKGEGKSASFIDAIVIDPLGIPTELYGDYSKYPPELAEQCDVLYNDGMSFLDKRHLMSTTAEFVDWLTDWQELAGIKVTRKAPRKVKEKIVDAGISLIDAGVWESAA